MHISKPLNLLSLILPGTDELHIRIITINQRDIQIYRFRQSKVFNFPEEYKFSHDEIFFDGRTHLFFLLAPPAQLSYWFDQNKNYFIKWYIFEEFPPSDEKIFLKIIKSIQCYQVVSRLFLFTNYLLLQLVLNYNNGN